MRKITSICDQCGKEQNQSVCNWQLTAIVYLMPVTKEFCSLDCLIAWANQNKTRETRYDNGEDGE